MKIRRLLILVSTLASIAGLGNARGESVPQGGHYRYDLVGECGFSFESTRKFSDGQDSCHLLYRDSSGSPFFYGSITSGKVAFKEKDRVGLIDLSGGHPRSARSDYYDAQRDVTQNIIQSKRVRSPRGNADDIVIVTRLVVSYAVENGRALTPVKQLYECWDGFFHGAATMVSLALCSVLPTGSGTFASSSSWQARIIKSLVIE
ncbi:hypothetical protein [Burkholderia sp. IMCC1007]|uniref:hypothetical protein n=1 Tax=Burkholderia sp. IMCC1007 TaxID=3004104 RepID=UPI0022B3F870|nr:hypothetical protein [Burkholderia sp. IMCC1007]